MTTLEAALKLAAFGFYVFPVRINGKLPTKKGWKEKATRDPETIRRLWKRPFNVGIFCGKFGDGSRKIVAVDIDNKGGLCGDDGIFLLELEGKELPETYEQRTPTGGRHLLLVTDADVGNGDSRFPDGINIRGRGGFVLGAGSIVDKKLYTATPRPLAEAPQWLIEMCKTSEIRVLDTTCEVDEDYAEQRATELLQMTDGAEEGARGSTAYKVAQKVRDLGVSALSCFELMNEHWAPKCDPPMPEEDLMVAVDNAYRYGQNTIGARAPENEFDEIPDEPEKLNPVEKMNLDHAFVVSGGSHHILHETIDHKGVPRLAHLAEQTFHRKYASQVISVGDGDTKPLTQIWMKSKNRRSYDGFCFRPGLEAPPGYYNLFRGFAVKPAADGSMAAHESLHLYLEHIHENICGSDKKLTNWLVSYFAHLFQKPWEKPHVAPVFRGEKGVGKNAVVDTIGRLLGTHFVSASHRRYLVGSFNSHLENCLMVLLNEAFWSGDKAADGILKDLVTGETHRIERKGQESYEVDNCTRVVILGNDDWLVPASHDERRYAIFDVGNRRKQDFEYFGKMMSGMADGGHALLLQYFFDYDISNFNPRKAPNTDGLLAQKLCSLEPLHQWWLDGLMDGEISHSEFADGTWPGKVPKKSLREAVSRYWREHNLKIRLPDERAIGRMIRQCCPSIESGKLSRDEGHTNAYTLPSLKVARQEFETFIGHEVSWE
jgi:hypothetical protein